MSCPPVGLPSEQADKYFFKIEDAVRNTPERKAKFDQMSKLISGRCFTAPVCSKPESDSPAP